MCSLVVVDPSGFAQNVENSDRADSISTREPCARAATRADTTSGREDTDAVAGAAGAAGASPAAVSVSAVAEPASTPTSTATTSAATANRTHRNQTTSTDRDRARTIHQTLQTPAITRTRGPNDGARTPSPTPSIQTGVFAKSLRTSPVFMTWITS